MIQLPPHLYNNYLLFCRHCGVKENDSADYMKWLRYFLDFCKKYHIDGEESQRIRLFQNKLYEKKQSDEQRRRASHAVSLYFDMIKGHHSKAPGTRKPENDHDLHPLRSGQNCEGAEKPVRFLKGPADLGSRNQIVVRYKA